MPGCCCSSDRNSAKQIDDGDTRYSETRLNDGVLVSYKGGPGRFVLHHLLLQGQQQDQQESCESSSQIYSTSRDLALLLIHHRSWISETLTAMSTKKLLTVFGATGNQGGSVISAILSCSRLSSKFALRAITRDPSKPNAQSLAEKGVELTKADLNDPSSIASAIRGSYGVFAVTNYWETTSKETEVSQGKNIVNACKEEGVKHLVWSCLPHVTELTGGELSKVEHFDGKAEVAEYAAKDKGDLIVSTWRSSRYRVLIRKPGVLFHARLLHVEPTRPDQEAR